MVAQANNHNNDVKKVMDLSWPELYKDSRSAELHSEIQSPKTKIRTS